MIPRAFLSLITWLCLASICPESAAQNESAAGGESQTSNRKSTIGEADTNVPVNPAEGAPEVPPGILDGGSEWLNTAHPIDLRELRGKVVVIDFWTYCCINCIHVLPDLKFLEEKYANELVVIGVHSAKFDNEKVSANIRQAILRYEISHPVVNDDQMTIWRKFGVRSWPTLALIDPEGRYLGALGGEGNRKTFDKVIGQLVTYHRWKGTLNEKPIQFELESSQVEETTLRYPGKVLAESDGNRVFISDSNHNQILITDSDGRFVNRIGSGKIGSADGSFQKASFDHPQGMELVGNKLFVADTENHSIRVVDLIAETVSTLAGTGEQGRPRQVNGELKTTKLNSPWDLCHIDGTLFIAMAGPHQIWSHELGSNEIDVYAGTAAEDVRNGPLPESAFAQPSGLTPGENGTSFYVADSEGSAIRRVPVSRGGSVTTLAGTFELPRGQSLFAFGDVDAKGVDARFQHPLGVAWHDGFVYVADTYNHKIRKVDAATGEVTTWLGDGTNGRSLAELNEPSGLSVANGKLYIADTNNHRILMADLATKEVSELQITGLPKEKVSPTRRPSMLADARKLDEVLADSEADLNLTIDMSIPTGGKLNDLAPVTCSVFVLDGEAVLGAAALQNSLTAEVENGVAQVRVPMSGVNGTAKIAIEFSYGYCESQTSDVCRIANSAWVMTLQASKDQPNSQLKLVCPTEGDSQRGSNDQ